MLLPLLPPELKLSIADHLDPFSTFNFGLTSKEQWETCRPVIERHARSFAEAPVVDAVDVWKVLRDVLQDDSQARYVTELSLPANWQMQQPSTPVEDLDLLQDAARALLDIYPQLDESGEETLIERIVEGVAAGWPSSIIVVLIHHLPNLKTFKITGPGDSEEKECEVLEDFLFKVATDLGNTAKASKLPFQRLRTVALSYWDTEYCVSANQVLPFLHVPSLRTFAGHALSGFFWNSNRAKNIASLHPQSNIEEFYFVDCQFSASAVEYMLSCTQSLKRFTYSAGGCNICASHYDAKKVLKSLSTHAWHSLEHLLLIHPSYKEQELSYRHNYVPAKTDLTMFTRLHSLCANWAMLWPDPEYMPFSGEDGHRTGFDLLSTTFDIRDELPRSLKNLDLSGVFNDEEREGLVGPLSTTNEQTPELTVGGIRVLTPSVLADVDGWDESEVTKVFGGGDGAWLRKVWAPCAFAHINKRY